MFKYEMIVYWSNEDEAFIVDVPELPGCMADGKTYQEAVVVLLQSELEFSSNCVSYKTRRKVQCQRKGKIIMQRKR